MSSGYFKGVISEAKRVEWPKGKELRKMTMSVVQVSVVFAIIFIIMDFLINMALGALGI